MHLLITLALITALVPLPALPGSQTPGRSADFTPAPCMFDLPPGAVEGQTIDCGYLRVPEEHAHPDGPTIQLAVAIIRSPDPRPEPDPLVMLQGGPGGSTLEDFPLLLFLISPLRANRDIILFDQRGTKYSEPSLMCTEIDQLTLDTIEQRLTPEESDRLSLEAFRACRDRLQAEGVNLAAFDSLENAADIEALRVALGYDQINLYGVSYGTLLALHTMRLAPQGLRSVVLDAVVPPQTDWLGEVPRSQDRAFNALFEACAANPDCQRAFPDLERVLTETVTRLNDTPARIPLRDPDSGRTYNAVIDGDSMRGLLFQLMYNGSFVRALPRAIYDASRDDYALMERIAPLVVFNRSISYGMYNAVVCAEDATVTSPPDLTGIDTRLADDATRSLAQIDATCDLWNVPPLPAAVHEPVQSDIPTLVLAGAFDPITPPAFAAEAARTLPNSFFYTFPAGSHGVALDSRCAATVMLAFLDNPTQEPNTNCIAAEPAPDFMTPANTIFASAVPRLVTLSSGPDIAVGLVLIACILGLLTLFVVLPVVWLVRRLRSQPGPVRTRAGALTRWLAVVVAILYTAFPILLLAVLLPLILRNDPVVLLGLPRASWPVLAIVPLGVLGTLGMLVGNILSWRAGSGSRWGRVYDSFLVVMALGASVALSLLGFVNAPFGI